MIIAERLVSFHFLGTGIELCKSAHSVPRQPFSALYACRKVVIPRFLNRVTEIESELAVSSACE